MCYTQYSNQIRLLNYNLLSRKWKVCQLITQNQLPENLFIWKIGCPNPNIGSQLITPNVSVSLLNKTFEIESSNPNSF